MARSNSGKSILYSDSITKTLLIIAGIILLYYCSAQINFSLGSKVYYSWPLWIPVGVLLSALLVSKENLIPSIFIGHLFGMGFFILVNSSASSLIFAPLLALVETTELYVAYKVFVKVISDKKIYNHTRNFTKYLIIIIIISIISSAISSFIMVMAYSNSFTKLPYIALKWFLGHASSYILITPLIIYWQSTSFVKWSAPKILEFLLLLFFLVIVIFTIFSGRFSASVIFFSPYVIGPFLLWSIIRFSNRVLTIYLTVISLIAILSTIKGTGPFYRESLYGTQILLQGFLFILYLSTFLLYATISELREAKNVLKTYKEELEELVEKRSEEINQKNKRLEEEIEFRIKTEKRLRELSQAVEQSPASVIITDKNGIIVYANPKFIEMRGYKQQDVIGKNPSLFKSGVHDQKFYKNLWGTILKGKIWKGEILNKKKNGQLFWESALISPILNEEGEIHNFVGIYEDISKQKEAEDEIEKYITKLGESEYQLQMLNQNKDKFFSILAHDLKGPFSSLLGFSEFLVNDFEELTLKEIKEYSNNIYDSSKNTYKLLENLLEWGRVQRNLIDLEFENINLLEIAKNTIELYSAEAKKKKIKLELKIDKDPYVYADENTIATVFRNLTSNAIKFCEAGDVITISSTPVNEGIEVTISDTGIGISEDDKEKLFRIDVHHTLAGTAQEKGTGLGLILCKDLLEKNNSEIKVESKLGKGTSFNFVLQRSVD